MKFSISGRHSVGGRLVAGATIVFVLATTLLLLPGCGDDDEAEAKGPPIMSPQSFAYDQTYAEWAAAWWKWAISIPASTSPLRDQTGEFAAVGQSESGPVWFLAGTQGGSAERTVTVPADRALFFPIVNTNWINLPPLGDNPWSPEQDLFARGYIGDSIDTATDLLLEIDGKPIQDLEDYRIKTSPVMVFMVEVPADDIFGYVDMGLSPGTQGPCVDDGYYVMLEPLSRGSHTIHFRATVAQSNFQLEVTYHLTVE
jgi:hypothetical protein